MDFKVKVSKILCISTILVNLLHPNNAADIKIFEDGFNTFSVRLHHQLNQTNLNENVVFSPFSIQSTLAMVHMGVDGDTARDIERVALYPKTPKDIANSYRSLLEKYRNSSILNIANKLYIEKGYEVQQEFKKSLTESFSSSIDTINFNKDAQIIENWVQKETNGSIKHLMKSNPLDNSTRLMLVSALHLKLEQFIIYTEDEESNIDFYVDETNKIKVENMYSVLPNSLYADLPEFNATALVLPYQDSDLYMLIILPNSRTGLDSLEYKLEYTNTLSIISKALYKAKVYLFMPKFRVEFEEELSVPLKRMGMNSMFSDDPDFSKMLEICDSLGQPKLVHKTVIEVKEAGTATENDGSGPISFNPIKNFQMDRPFHYVIANKDNVVLFKGNVKTISYDRNN